MALAVTPGPCQVWFTVICGGMRSAGGCTAIGSSGRLRRRVGCALRPFVGIINVVALAIVRLVAVRQLLRRRSLLRPPTAFEALYDVRLRSRATDAVTTTAFLGRQHTAAVPRTGCVSLRVEAWSQVEHMDAAVEWVLPAHGIAGRVLRRRTRARWRRRW